MIERRQAFQQSSVFLKQNPDEADMTLDELQEMAWDSSDVFLSKILRYVANIANTNAYWHSVREDLMTNTGVSTFFAFLSADMHWPELHDLFGGNVRILHLKKDSKMWSTILILLIVFWPRD